ncbi:hypothetical protein [Thermogutta sp.]|uniref:hypothetical protein n=1 Tax=Thermogutta sp. TaxID=1962930 RepID=UPI00321FDDD3
MNKLTMTTQQGVVITLRRVPAYAMANVGSEIRLPKEPLVEVKTVAGIERVPALQGSPERLQYERELEDALAAQERARLCFAVNYGVVEWKDGRVTRTQPPDDWELDPLLGNISTGNRRVDYILFELLTAPDDLTTAIKMITGEVSEEEIKASERLF